MAELLVKIIRGGFRLLVHWKKILIFKLDPTRLPELSLPPGAEFFNPSTSDTDDIGQLLHAVAGSERYRSISIKFDNNADCFAARVDGRVVAAGWGVRHEDVDPTDGFSIIPSQNQIVLVDLYTDPDYRGRGLLPYILQRQLHAYIDEGIECIIAIDDDNRPSIRVAEKLGFVLARAVPYFRLFGIKLTATGGIRIESEQS